MKRMTKREQLIKFLQGKYAHAPTSSEDFARRKQEEIDWEERNIVIEKPIPKRSHSESKRRLTELWSQYDDKIFSDSVELLREDRERERE